MTPQFELNERAIFQDWNRLEELTIAAQTEAEEWRTRVAELKKENAELKRKLRVQQVQKGVDYSRIRDQEPY